MPADQDGSAPLVERPGFRIRQSLSDNVVVLSVEDVVDLVTAPELGAAINEALAQSPAGLIVDLSDVTFLASAGMTTLVKARGDAGTTVPFGIVADGPTTSRPLKLLGLDDTLAIYSTLDDALLALR
jgi:anti-sigma B factor antagonist